MTYASTDELNRRIAANGKSVSDVYAAELGEALDAASDAIDAHCGRTFAKSTTATARYYWPRYDYDRQVYVVDLHPDVWSITSVKHDPGDDGTYETTWTATTDYVTLPRNGYRDGVDGWPYEALLVRSTTALRLSGDLEPVEVTGKAGWSVTPPQVKQACLMIATELFKMREAPFGVVGFADLGLSRVRDNPKVTSLLKPFVKGGTALPGIA